MRWGIILGGGGDDTVNVHDRNSLSGVNGQLFFDGDAHTFETVRQVNASEFDADLLNNLPFVFVDSAPDRTFVDSDGKELPYTLPVLKSIIKGDEADGDPITGDLQVRAVALYTQNVQLQAVHELGVQKRDLSDNILWIGLDGNETIDGGETGIPVIERVQSGAQGATLVYLDEEGFRVFTNTGVPSIAEPLGGDTPLNVYIDANGRRTFTVTFSELATRAGLAS